MGGKGSKKPGRFRKAKGTYFFYIFIFFFIGGYALFFSSRGWMSTQSLAKKQTELHKEVEWENRKVRIIRWEYSEEQHLMEVELDITNTKYDGLQRKDRMLQHRYVHMLLKNLIMEPTEA